MSTKGNTNDGSEVTAWKCKGRGPGESKVYVECKALRALSASRQRTIDIQDTGMSDRIPGAVLGHIYPIFQ